MLNNILEVIDYILDEQNMQIFFVDFPLNGEGMLIELSNSTISEDLDGLTNTYFSHVQFFIRMEKKTMSYVQIDNKIKDLYKKVYDSQNQVIENYEIIRVSPYELSSFSVDKDTVYIVSLDFDITYKN